MLRKDSTDMLSMPTRGIAYGRSMKLSLACPSLPLAYGRGASASPEGVISNGAWLARERRAERTTL